MAIIVVMKWAGGGVGEFVLPVKDKMACRYVRDLWEDYMELCPLVMFTLLEASRLV